jgi:hypothetical protein
MNKDYSICITVGNHSGKFGYINFKDKESPFGWRLNLWFVAITYIRCDMKALYGTIIKELLECQNKLKVLNKV